jgi:protein-S-isoprenylcysteine O-methyltransferase Ste14
MQRVAPAIGSIVFFVLAPGVVAGLIPWWLTGWERGETWMPLRVGGVLLIVAGLVVLIYSFVQFVVEGIGTPAPVAPTEHLVVGGMYRYVRNPMYVAVVGVIIGQGLAWGRHVLLLYGLIAGGVMAGFARFYEEPNLRRRYGESYEAYRQAVPAWWPPLTPWSPGQDP